jgi:uncharacterized membrane protein YphA (DoxX/SURF4 family)
MKLRASIKDNIVTVICYLYVLLFVYAAVSKLLDFENFQVQIAQSPLLTAYAGFFSKAIIIVELIIAVLLTIRRFRIIALFSAYTIMILFSVYIFIILNYSPYVPCSCGGILEKMGWKEHLVFNIIFSIIGIIALYLLTNKPSKLSGKNITLKLAILTVSGTAFMFIMFYTSEDTLHHRNNFVRRIPPFVVDKAFEIDLIYNSFYFAGVDDNTIYLGNTTAPSIVTVIDSALTSKVEKQIQLNDELVNITEPLIKVLSPYVFVFDGLSSSIYRGNISDWEAELKITNIQRFTIAEPVDSVNIIFRAATVDYGNLLGKFNFEDRSSFLYNDKLLQKQIDGLFDTDGTMHYSKENEQFVYVYYYRNEYIITDKNLNLKYRGKTIDTTNVAKIKIEYINKKQQYKLAAPPLIVNRKSSIHKNLLFINSMLSGRYDPEVMKDKASVIDVYNINNNSYVMSFYIHKIDNKAFDNFIVTEKYLYALFGKTLVAYKFDSFLTKEFE